MDSIIASSLAESMQRTAGSDAGENNERGGDLIAGASTSSNNENRNTSRPSRTSLYRFRLSINSSNRRIRSQQIQEEAWSCLIVLLTFWFFAASMTLILGFYGSVNLELGPNYSRVIHANSYFVQEIKVNGDRNPGPMLYGFSKKPPLDIKTTWNETHHAFIQANYHQEWMVWLNKGAIINVSYSIKTEGFSKLILVLVEGKTGLNEWIEEPSYPNASLSWNNINGNGTIQYNVDKDSDYYIAIGNLNPHSMEVHLNFRLNASLYDTTDANYKCSLQHNLCGVKLFLLGDNYAVLTTPSPKESGDRDEWYVKLSYGPRWITYFVGSGGITIFILVVLKIISKLWSSSQEPEIQSEQLPTERTPLIPQKEDDDTSCGSLYGSSSLDDEDEEESFLSRLPMGEGTDPKSQKDSEVYHRRLCAICFDAPRDSFFLPCGHCATCFTCGMRIAEESNVCPICRRKIKRVRKIFTV